MGSPFPSRFVNLVEARRRFSDRVDRIGAFLSRVDPIADAAVDALRSLPRDAGWEVFRRATSNGSAASRDAPDAVRALVASAEHVPAWVDWSVVDAGGAVLLRAGPIGGLVLGLKSLVLAYTSPAGNKPLVFSGRMTEQAPRRLLETARFVRATILPGSMRPHAPGWRLTLQVRLIHAEVRRMILATGRWDPGAWGLPINQHDEAGTSYLFSQAVLAGVRRFGLRVDANESDAYMHLWRWSAHVMGIDAELVPATETDAVRLAELMRVTQAAPDDDSRALTKALLETALRDTPAGREAAARRALHVASALCRMLVGDEVADQLGVARTRLANVTPLLRGGVARVDRLARLVPWVREEGVRAGRRYWNQVTGAEGGAEAEELGLPGLVAKRNSS